MGEKPRTVTWAGLTHLFPDHSLWQASQLQPCCTLWLSLALLSIQISNLLILGFFFCSLRKEWKKAWSTSESQDHANTEILGLTISTQLSVATTSIIYHWANQLIQVPSFIFRTRLGSELRSASSTTFVNLPVSQNLHHRCPNSSSLVLSSSTRTWCGWQRSPHTYCELWSQSLCASPLLRIANSYRAPMYYLDYLIKIFFPILWKGQGGLKQQSIFPVCDRVWETGRPPGGTSQQAASLSSNLHL